MQPRAFVLFLFSLFLFSKGFSQATRNSTDSLLASVSVKARKLAKKRFGVTSSGGLMNFTDGSLDQRDAFEIAQLISLPTVPSRITSLHLFVTEPRADSGIFCIHFYSLDGGRPTTRIFSERISQTKAIKEGWLTFDLTRYNLRLSGPCVAAIEFIPKASASGPVYYAIRPGGSQKSFVRNGRGDWRAPPHQYRMYVTALVPRKGKQAESSEEKEIEPTHRLFSKAVQDSFSIFIQLPAKYKKEKRRMFPVVYLLDANLYFDRVAKAAAGKDVILVGIGYRDFLQMDSLRNRDYTFPVAAPQDSFAVSGGGERFLSFLKDELIPLVDSLYSVKGSRTLMGHSLGGYFTLYALEQAMRGSHHSFDRYVAASPSLHYGDGYLPKQFEQLSALPGSAASRLFMTFGEREDAEDGTTDDSITRFNNLCRLLSEKHHVVLKNKVLPASGHIETAIPTFIQALEDLE